MEDKHTYNIIQDAICNFNRSILLFMQMYQPFVFFISTHVPSDKQNKNKTELF